MFNWLKRKKEHQETCRHYKKFGEKVPTNMAEIIRFSPYETDTIGYGISECTVCGKRAFSCIGCHAMGQYECGIIDNFIAYKIEWPTFQFFLDRDMAWNKKAGELK